MGTKSQLVGLILCYFFLPHQLTVACSRSARQAVTPPPSPKQSSNGTRSGITCVNENGQQLSWFMAYKFGRIRESSNEKIRQGVGYVTLTPGADKWSLSNYRIHDSSSVLLKTIGRLWGRKTPARNQLYIFYNDQPPNRTAASYNGHMKGIIIAQAEGGIWIQHSLPKFPQLGNEFEYPENGDNNAQLFYCMTLTPKNLDAVVGDALVHAKPIVYDSYIPESLKAVYPNLAKVADKKPKRNRNDRVMHQLVDVDINMTIFAKGPKFEKDIYLDWIAPTLDTGLKVQSWLQGSNSMPSSCTSPKYQILNIADKELQQHKFSSKRDHSKWAISHASGWACISDLNRAESQKLRGGTALCTSDPRIWKSFEKAVIDVQPCPRI